MGASTHPTDKMLKRIFFVVIFFAFASVHSAEDSLNSSVDKALPTRLTLPQRLTEQFLATFETDRQRLAKQVKPIDVPYQFVRGNFHFHSHFSHDSVGTLEEIVQAAKETNTQVIGFTEHPDRAVDVVAENVKGWHQDVYFLAGTEANNQLHWPAQQNEPELRFVCHPEEVDQFDLTIYDGIEIYNTHSDVQEENQATLITAMLMNLKAVQKFPEAAFCCFLDYPQDFLKRYDRLTQIKHFAGIAGNDSHQNQRLKIEAHPDGKLIAYDGTNDPVWEDTGIKAGLLRTLLGHPQPPVETKVLADALLDPYPISMQHVGTYLQLKDGQPINEHSVRQALRTGRVILGFELIAPLPAVGFYVEQASEAIGTVGDEIPWQEDLSLHIALPLSAEIRLIRNGQVFREVNADSLHVEQLASGVYRLEAFQQLAGQRYPWVLSNPIYVADP